MQRVTVIINYCSNERPYLSACIEQCARFASEIIVSFGSKLYSGADEDFAHIADMQKKYPFVKFVQYPVDITIDLKTQKGVVNRPHAYWHNLARWAGVHTQIVKEWVLFLDVDEIPDGDSFLFWLQTHQLDAACTYKLANYWYFKKPIFQAKTWEDTAVLAHANLLNENAVFGDAERDQIFAASQKHKYRYVLGNDFQPLIHHYSWVRTPEQMLFKLKNWGHQTDFQNHEQMVAHVFKDDNVNDIVHNYQYQKVVNRFNLDLS